MKRLFILVVCLIVGAVFAQPPRTLTDQGIQNVTGAKTFSASKLCVLKSISGSACLTFTGSGSTTLDLSSIAANAITALTGDVTASGTGSVAATIGAAKVTSSMLNANVFSTAHSWGGQQTFIAPILGTPVSGVATNLTGTAAGLTAGNATTLATARTINGVSFNGSANITVPPSAVGGCITTTMSGDLTLGTGLEITCTVTGATVGMLAMASPNVDMGIVSGPTAWVSATNTVKVRVCGLKTLTLPDTTFRVVVLNNLP